MDIPADYQNLSAKELMKILDSLNIKRDDCFEKSELVKRVEEHL
jgi:hypothetical protein